MSLIRNIFLALFMFATTLVAHANPLSIPQQDLGDYLTPLETMQEFGLNPDGVVWQASFENPRLYIVVDKADHGDSPTAQTLFAFLDGKLVHKFKVSTAKEQHVTTPAGHTYFATTPAGEFRIYARDRYHKSLKWNGAEMNFAQFFNGGIAIHATIPMHYDALGHRDSGGCVRLYPTNAEIMWNLVGKVGTNDTKVIVFDGSSQNFPDVGQDMSQPIQQQVVKQEPKLPSTVATKPVKKAPVQQPIQDDEPAYQGQPYYPPPYQPQPYPYGYPQPPPPQQHHYQMPPQPTPPPPPPPGQPDNYPYCAPGYWCPYRT